MRTARTAGVRVPGKCSVTSLILRHRYIVKLGYKATSWSGSSGIGCARWSGGWTRRESRRRADTIIAQLTQANSALAWRLPELEAPSEPRYAPQTASTLPGEPAAWWEAKNPDELTARLAARPVTGVLRLTIQEDEGSRRRPFGG